MSATEIDFGVIQDNAFIERRKDHCKTLESNAFDATINAFGVCSLPFMIALVILHAPTVEVDKHPESIGLWIVKILWNILLIVGFPVTIYCFVNHYRALKIRFNKWRRTPEHWFCPQCRSHLSSLLSWQCPRCLQLNAGDANHSFFGTCRRCNEAPEALICPCCRRTIALASAGPYLSIAVVAVRSIPSSEHQHRSMESMSF